MKYYLDTEFLEGTQKKRILGIPYGNTKETIDLISIGIVSEDNREYYAICNEFNLEEAWNRHNIITDCYNAGCITKKEYWIRDNVLLPIYLDLLQKSGICGDERNYWDFNKSSLKKLISWHGKSKKQIAEGIKSFCLEINFNDLVEGKQVTNPEFYGYYADYDWVVFCWLFGKMLDLPKGFPMIAFDIQQQIKELGICKNELLNEVPQDISHHSLKDAIWNKNAYTWIQNRIKNEKR